MNTHLTDQEIQQLAEVANTDEHLFNSHLETCTTCRAKYAMYKLLFKEIPFIQAPAVPPGFEAKVMKTATKKREQKIIRYYRLIYGAAIAASLIAISLFINSGTIKHLIGIYPVFNSKISALEAVLTMSAIAFFYICLIGYNARFKKENSLSYITL